MRKRNDYAEHANSISIAEVIEGKLWVIYPAGLISRISATGHLRILERLRILEKLRSKLEVSGCF
jgi:hypothetical protein